MVVPPSLTPTPAVPAAPPGGAGVQRLGRTGWRGLFLAKSAAGLIAFLANLYLARALGGAEFGRYSFTIATLTFLSFCFDFGFFASGARLLAVTEGELEMRGTLGAVWVLLGITSALFILVVLAAGAVVDWVFEDRIGPILRTVAVLAPAMIAPFVVDQVLKACGRVYLYASWIVLNKLLFLVALAVFGVLGSLSASTASAGYLGAGLAALLYVGVAFPPRFSRIAPCIREIAAEQRRFGSHLYAGKTANLLSYNIDKVLIAYFHGPLAVGCYSLAMNLGSLSNMFSQAVAAAEFRSFAGLRTIPEGMERRNAAGILLVSAASLAAGECIVRLYLGADYATVGWILPPALAASALQAAYQPYNSWLLANGFGEDLRRLLYTVASINLLGNFLLVPRWGALGAAAASILGMGAYLFLARRGYRRRALR